MKAGASAQDIAIAEAQLAQARLDLLAAEERLAESTIVAPFDGLVTEVFVSIGERATAEVLELVSSDLEVVLQVDELDIGSLKIGQPAQITVEAWPAEELQGSDPVYCPQFGQ